MGFTRGAATQLTHAHTRARTRSHALASLARTIPTLCLLQHTLRDGATWHVLPSEWWREWCSYTGFSADAGCVTASPAGPRPGPIDNSKLIDSAYASVGILRKVIQEGEDYVLVESRSATLLEGWYGLIGPSLARRVITVGLRKKTRVDLFPVFVRLIECDSHGVPDESTATIRSFTAKSLFSDVQEEQHNRVIEAERQQQAEQADAEVRRDATRCDTSHMLRMRHLAGSLRSRPSLSLLNPPAILTS